MKIAWLPKAQGSVDFSVMSYACVKMWLATGFFGYSMVIVKSGFFERFSVLPWVLSVVIHFVSLWKLSYSE